MSTLWLVVAGAALALLLYMLVRTVRRLRQPIARIDVRSPPSFVFLAARIVLGMATKPAAHRAVAVPRLEIATIPFTLNPSGFHKFCHLCGYEDERHQLSSSAEAMGRCCYLEVLILPMQAILLGDPTFPIRALAMIHLRNEFIQYRPIQDELITVRGHLEGQRITDKGIEVDMVFSAVTQHSPAPVWKCVMTLLSRLPQKKPSSSSSSSSSEKRTQDASSAASSKELLPLRHLTTWKLAGNTGLKYARLSNDWNPHHLFPLTAKLFGYHKPIAQGMYTLSRAISDVAHSNLFDIQYPYQITAEYKRPIFLPSKELQVIVERVPAKSNESTRTKASGLIPEEAELASNDAISFAVESGNHEPHLKGKIVILSEKSV